MSDHELVPVGIGECRCPGTPHPDGDTVYLRPKLGLASGIAIQKLIVDANQSEVPVEAAALTGVLAEAYLLHGVADWTLQTDAGLTPVNPITIRAYLLDDFERAERVADAADDLYMPAVLGPLLRRAATSSPSTSTNGSTSATGAGTRKPRKRPKPSSTSTSPMADTVATSKSPVGVSNS